jgi:hypothetical protein
MRFWVGLCLALALASPAHAEGRGCGAFKWPISHEQALLTGTSQAAVASGATLDRAVDTPVALSLQSAADAKLPHAPERAPKSAKSFAGFLRVPALPHAGRYKISLSADSWIDVVKDGVFLKPAGFSGALECDGIRKSVKFDMLEGLFVIQLSGAAAKTIHLVITAD